MKRNTLIRVGIAAVLLTVLCVVASPRRVVDTLASADWQWMLLALMLAPVFVALRMAKWYLLVRQSMDRIPLADFARGYLLGMTAGLITPARVGEVARVWTLRADTQGQRTVHVGYFVAEKLLEVVCLLALALAAVASRGLAASHYALVLVALLIALVVVHQTRTWWAQVFYHLPRIRRWPKAEVSKVVWAVTHLRLMGCFSLSLSCFVVYLLQVSILMHAMGQTVGWQILTLLPLVMMANLVPITPGGFGMREGLAVVLLKSGNVPEPISLGSFFLTTFFDLVLPALVGTLLLLRRGGPTKSGESTKSGEETS